ncbi:DUF1642 domain-containing protein [Streptococcus lutetiensis]|uniref:DUF1642 domain-containing protein n=1 Tax=Streptococcus lutetiensis TaxID=150055 RepID=UPI001BDB522B|nr:DUF1642 domain-containing protein [Streptococcus lutetiensis]MBT0897656.1 DUF1642 domain-containing protein [Streptococcus lutetiensis]MBT1056407.1 DUF1642 domain-containing protein [Streptococcus lutetiensis]MBT1058163.1 DUF1642 domain-containing protein [Streptococcus lutetiensis]
MNKQELIEKIEKEKSPFNAWEDLVRNRAFEDALTIVRKIDEPKKPVVPQFVADFYELIKDDFEYGVYELCVNFYNCGLSGKIKHWFDCNDTNPIQVLVNMHQFGYEVEKEKLYTVEIPNPNRADVSLVLGLYNDGKVAIFAAFTDSWKYEKQYKLTEAEIKEDFERAWQFAKEVKMNND